jgi:serine/threonine protein kinase
MPEPVARDQPPTSDEHDSFTPEELVAAVRREQRRRWLQGDRVPIETYLAEFPVLHEDRARVLALIDHEVALREEAGETPTLDEYLRRFPGDETALRRLFALHRAVSGGLLRKLAAPRPPPAEAATLPPAPAGSQPDTLPAEGHAVAGYEIVKELGRGGMGVVYQARQTALKRTVALKMVLAGAHAGEADLARFRTEAEAVARMQHPNIVQIHDVGERDGLPYFSLEYVDGGSLADQLDGTPWPARQAAELVETLARAMDYAHQRGIVHRDLKPANVLLTADGTPKITDFGLAKQLEEKKGLTRTGAVMGTPSYMAPEQAEGKAKEIGPAADVWALGAILYQLLTGQPPFQAATALDTLLLVVSADPMPPRERNPGVPRDLETICLKCLQRETEKRYASAGDLADDLRCFLTGEPIKARPPSVGQRTVKAWKRGDRWARRTTGTQLTSVLLGASLLVGASSLINFGASHAFVLLAAAIAVAVLIVFLHADLRALLSGAVLFTGVVAVLSGAYTLQTGVDLVPTLGVLMLILPLVGSVLVALAVRRRWRALGGMLALLGLYALGVHAMGDWRALDIVLAPLAIYMALALLYGVVGRVVAWYWKVPPLPGGVGAFWGSIVGAIVSVPILAASSLVLHLVFRGVDWVISFASLFGLLVLFGAVAGAAANAVRYREIQAEEQERLRRWGGA